MEQRGGFTKWLVLGLGIFLIFQYGMPLLSGGSEAPAKQPFTEGHYGSVPAGDRPEEQTCEIADDRAVYVLTSRGGSLKSATMKAGKYSGIELVTTTKEQRMPLRTGLRAAGDQNLVPTDNLDFTVSKEGDACVFSSKGDGYEIQKTVKPSGRPYELDLTMEVKNVGAEAKPHRFTVEQSSWRTKAETEASFWDMGKVPEWVTQVVAHTDKETDRLLPSDFDPGDFEDEEFATDQWRRSAGNGMWAAVSSNYFASAVIHKAASSTPTADTLVEDGTYFGASKADPSYGHLYRARLAYEAKTLGPGESARYETAAYMGPKARELLAGVVAGGDKAQLTQVIELGMFGAIGKVLVGYTYWLHKLVGSWGWAICLLTLTVKLAVFPLQFPQLRTSVAMRRVKPQMDEINDKYKDDMMQKNVALQELYKREGIRPLIGCLPMMLQMPVWISLYQSLGTAVELYRTPFGPLIADLSLSDPYHVIPVVLGASSFLQQKLMPVQGMDPAQAKMMLYLMPGMFMVMMFFMPAGLGVYMLTNTWLGIVQQVLVERWTLSKLQTPATIGVREVSRKDDKALDAPKLGKGKARVRG